MAIPTVQIQIYVGTKELKEAIERYAEDVGQPVWAVISVTWIKFFKSKDFSISVCTLYEDSLETGLKRHENQAQRRFKLTMPPELVRQIDELIELRKNNEVINRSLISQEAIKRYLEPELIEKGYLETTQFKDKVQAAKNLKAFRESLGLNRMEFNRKYFTIDEHGFISYSQYSLIERTGKGNIDKLLDILSEEFLIDKEIFYYPTLKFLHSIERITD